MSGAFSESVVAVTALPEEEHMTEVKKHSFAKLDAVERQRMASLGGKTAHELGKAHKFTVESARQAGLKGAAVRRQKAEERAALQQKNREVQS